MSHKKTILLFGVSGFVGSNFANFFSKYYKVVGTYHKNKVSIENVLTLPCNVLNRDEVRLILYAFKPDIAIYCTGIPSLHDCSQKEELADALNADGLLNVAEACQRYKSKICLLSSHYVFKGGAKEYVEMDIPDANTVLGKTQASAEFYIQRTGLNYVIFRCCKLYGRSINPMNPTWFDNLQRHLSLKRTVAYDDYIRSGFLDISYLAMIMKMAFDKDVSKRLFQVSSRDIGTHYQFAANYTKIFNDPGEYISRGKWFFPFSSDATPPESNETSYTMSLANIEGFLGIRMPTIEESIRFTKYRLRGKDKAVHGQKGEGVTFI